MKSQPRSGVSAITPVASDRGQDRRHEDFAAAEPVAEPAEQYRSRYRPDPRGEQDRARLPEGQVPIAHKECEDKTDQEKIDEIDHYRKQTRRKDLPLVDRQRGLPVEQVEHAFLWSASARFSCRRRRRERQIFTYGADR
jgi:hypothetical protein